MEENKSGESGTITIKKDSLWKYSTFVLLAVVVIVGFFMLKPSGGTGAVVGTDTGSDQHRARTPATCASYRRSSRPEVWLPGPRLH